MNSIWITQVNTDEEHEICTVGFPDGDARQVFGQISRMPWPKAKAGDLPDGCLLVTLQDDNGDAADDDPLVIPYANADWLLGEFFHAPRRVLRRLIPPGAWKRARSGRVLHWIDVDGNTLCGKQEVTPVETPAGGGALPLCGQCMRAYRARTNVC